MTAHEQISTPEGLSLFAQEWFGVVVPQTFADRMSSAARGHENRWETTAGPYCWLKNRITEESLLPTPPCLPPSDGGATAVLHVGFIWIRETDEMISRLRNEPTQPGSPARSRFFGEASRSPVSPIDATAARVTG